VADAVVEKPNIKSVAAKIGVNNFIYISFLKMQPGYLIKEDPWLSVSWLTPRLALKYLVLLRFIPGAMVPILKEKFPKTIVPWY
jgi:hypothetical protein